MHQGHMGFVAIGDSTPFGLSKTIFTFPLYFCKSWDSEVKYGKIGFGCFFRPYWGPDPWKNFFQMNQNHIYSNSITLLPKTLT